MSPSVPVVLYSSRGSADLFLWVVYRFIQLLWGIHLTGLILGLRSPGAVRGRAF